MRSNNEDNKKVERRREEKRRGWESIFQKYDPLRIISLNPSNGPDQQTKLSLSISTYCYHLYLELRSTVLYDIASVHFFI